jgi:hypothetical protein
MAADEWGELQGLVKQIYQGSSGLGAEARQAEPRARLDIALVQLLVEQMRQSTKVIYPALADLSSEIKKHREALVAAAASSDKSARAVVRLTVILALAACAGVAAACVQAAVMYVTAK